MTELTARPAMDAATGGRSAIPWPVFAVSVAGAFMVSLDVSIVNVAFPSMRESFPDTSTATLSWVLSGYSVVFGALLLGAGRLADRSGRRLWFQRGLVVFGLGSLLCAAAPSAELLIAGRVVQAVGAALLMPASLGLLLSACAPHVRTQAVTIWGGITALAVATGPSLGAILIDLAGWRMAFVINLPIAVVALVAAPRVVPESAIGGPPPDYTGVALVCIAVASAALGISQGGIWGWGAGKTVVCFLVAAVVGPLAVWRSAHHDSPAIDMAVLRERTSAAANAATLLYGVGFFAMLFANVLFLTGVWGYSTLKAGFAITPGPLVVAALSSRSGRLAARIGFRPVLLAGGSVMAAGLGWYVVFTGTEPNFLTEWLPGALLVGVGVALTFPVLSAAAVAHLPAERYSIGGALNQTARQLGAVLGVAILVAIIGTPESVEQAAERFQSAWIMCILAVGGSAAISAFQPTGRAIGPAS